MGNLSNESLSCKWLSVALIATVARLLCRELTLQNEYLKQKNKICRSKINKRINFTDDERRILVDAALAMARLELTAQHGQREEDIEGRML